MNEDHNFLWTHEASWVKAESFSEFIKSQPHEGRFLDNIFYYLVYNKYLNANKTIDAAWTVRFWGIIGMAFLCLLVYVLLKTFGIKSLHAFLLSIVVCTLPPFWRYLNILFVTHLIYSALFAIISGSILLKTLWIDKELNLQRITGSVLISIFFFFLSLNIYQPTAMAYWSVAILPLLMNQDEIMLSKYKLSFFIYLLVGFASMFIYYVVIKITYLFLDFDLQTRGGLITFNDLSHPFTIVSLLYNQLIWFVTSPLSTALSLWDVNNLWGTKYLVICIIAVGVLSDVFVVILQMINNKINKTMIVNNLLIKYLIFIILILLSYLPHLVVKDYDMQPIAYHRTLISLEIFILLLCFWSILRINSFLQYTLKFPLHLQERTIAILLLVIVIFTSLISNFYIDRYFAGFSAKEFKYVKSEIEEYGLSNISTETKIHILSDPSPHIVAVYSYTIFNLTRATSIVEQHAISIVKITLKELGLNPYLPIEFIRTNKPEYLTDKNVLIIDMRKFQKQTFQELNQPVTLKKILSNLN